MSLQKEIRIDKITLNFGAGKDQNWLEKGIKLINHIAGINPVKTKTQKRIPGWGLRPGLPIGAKLTLRGAKARKLLDRLLFAKDYLLKESNFDDFGNVSFGIPEYIDIKDIKYSPEIGIMGFEVAVTLVKPGVRVARRRIRPNKLGKKQMVTKEEALEFMKTAFNVKTGE